MDITKYAASAKIALTDDEARHISNVLNSLIAGFDALSDIDTTGIDPLYPVSENIFREDRVEKNYSRDELLAYAPYTHEGYYMVSNDKGQGTFIPLPKNDCLPAPNAEYIVACGITASNAACHDGLRYGVTYGELEKTRGAIFDLQTKTDIIIGYFVQSGENYKKYYEKALKIKTLSPERTIN